MCHVGPPATYALPGSGSGTQGAGEGISGHVNAASFHISHLPQGVDGGGAAGARRTKAAGQERMNCSLSFYFSSSFRFYPISRRIDLHSISCPLSLSVFSHSGIFIFINRYIYLIILQHRDDFSMEDLCLIRVIYALIMQHFSF